jgi:carbonic anhydrase
LTQLFKDLGIDRRQLPDNLTDYFGVFASERQNVIRGVDFIRQSPLIGPKIPVHGLMVDIQSGQLEWVVDGYDVLARPSAVPADLPSLGAELGGLAASAGFNLGEMKFPDSKIGETADAATESLSPPKRGAAPSSPSAPAQAGASAAAAHGAHPAAHTIAPRRTGQKPVIISRPCQTSPFAARIGK